MACDTLPSFESTFVNALECIRDEFISPDTKAVSAGQQLCKQIVAFIDEHYNDASLSTSAVGSYFDKSGPYLSRLFTDLHGCSIAAYITTVRIRESKVLSNKRPVCRSYKRGLRLLVSIYVYSFV